MNVKSREEKSREKKKGFQKILRHRKRGGSREKVEGKKIFIYERVKGVPIVGKHSSKSTSLILCATSLQPQSNHDEHGVANSFANFWKRNETKNALVT